MNTIIRWCAQRFQAHKMQRWVDYYFTEKMKIYPQAAQSHYDHLLIFLETCDKEIVDVIGSDVEGFRLRTRELYATDFHRRQAMKSLHCFLRFMKARGHRYLPSIS